jgi:phosphoesterase RecJ-like protein
MANSEACAAVAEKLKECAKIAILVHNSTDGDTLGSGLALAIALSKLGKEAAVLYEDRIPDNLSVLPGKEFLRLRGGEAGGVGDAGEAPCGCPAGAGTDAHEGAQAAAGADARDDARRWDAIIVVDTADPSRLGRRRQMLDSARFVVNIDHHITNAGYGDMTLIDSEASATAEVAYDVIRALGADICRDIALCIYTGICTDTGGFSYGNTTSRSHEIAAELLRFGLDIPKLHYLFFNAISAGKLRCHAYVASSLKFYYNGKLAVVTISGDALREMGADESDCEGLVDIGRNVIGVEASIMAREAKAGEFRVNLRSRNGVDVSVMAKKFGGGGHIAASGCTIRASSESIGAILVDAMSYAF